MPDINKILIANRGEIAVRIIRTCRDLGIRTVAVYSRPDEGAPHVLLADQSVFIGEAASSESYLSIDKMVKAAKDTEADAIHPGYGFLSENADFSRICEEEGIIFIGPRAESIKKMGDKTEARRLMKQAGVPYPPGSEGAMKSIADAKELADEIGYPVLIKAAAGGGGKGMRIVYDKERFEAGVKAARSEAKNAFGDDRVYIEKYLETPRHVEFQILADDQGHILHLFDRECSIQRRHQKVIEEAPCMALSDGLRNEMAEAAVAAARACNYTGAGTVEFLLDKHDKFYFLEMNTRLQVEHPITEMITGVDLVAQQIRVAEGKELQLKQNELKIDGHAIECRVYAEDPSDGFLPSTGVLEKHRPPGGPGVRVDAGVEEGQEITINYDPMIAKLCVHAPTRDQAIDRMLRALDEYEVAGCRTTIPFCSYVLKHPDFVRAEYDTYFVDEVYSPEYLSAEDDPSGAVLSVAAAILKVTHTANTGGVWEEDPYPPSTGGDRHPVKVSNPYSNWWKNRK
ncbi:MAG: acetyl-CoA carboxylase biotin carboxylase subunit [Balneolaceae bacterium]